MSTYTPSSVALVDITLPADGEGIDAADVNSPLQKLADGIAYLQAIGMKTKVFTSSATWNSPADCGVIGFVYGYGGGGPGGGGGPSSTTAGNSGCGGAGGAGSIARFAPVVLAPSTAYTVVVGAAQPGAAVGTTDVVGGNPSSFDSQVYCNGGGPGTGTADAATSVSSATRAGIPIGGGPTTDYNVRVAVVTISDLVSHAAGAGGAGLNAIAARASLAGNFSASTSASGGAGGAFGATSGGTHKGGGGGGGGGAGPGGVGGAGGAGGGGNSAGTGTAGTAGSAAAANTGAGGGGGGSGGQGSAAGGAAGAGGAGGSGKIVLFYFGTQT